MTFQALSRKNFTNKQHKIFQEAFDFFDQDNDGQVFTVTLIGKIFFSIISCFLNIHFQITKEEILTVMTNLGVEVSEEDLDKRMKEFDKDLNGIVEFSEFVYLMKDVLVDVEDDRLAENA